MNTLNEKLTYIGIMMSDLRGTWGDRYAERINLMIEQIEEALLIPKVPDYIKVHLEDALYISKDELRNIDLDMEDGRIFRDSSKLYSETFPDGVTKTVIEKLKTDMVYPENSLTIQEYTETTEF
jgi:hypothetical protein